MRVALQGALVASILLAGCGSASDSGRRTSTSHPSARGADAQDTAGGVSVAVDGLSGPGTRLADGVEVLPGSQLVGAVFPTVDLYADAGGKNPLGWQAALVVDAPDPTEVWDGYVDALGLAEKAGARRACVVHAPPAKGEIDVRRRFLTEPRLDDHEVLRCSARFGGTNLNMAVGALTCPHDQDEPAPTCRDRTVSHLFIEVTSTDDPNLAAGRELGTDELRYERSSETATTEREVAEISDDPIPDGPIILPTARSDIAPSPLPGAGDRVDDAIDYFLGDGDDWVAPAAILPKGSRSLVAPAMLIDCNSGLVAVVEVPGPPIEAVRAFAVSDPSSTAEPVQGRWAHGTWAGRAHESAGGYYLDMIAVPGSRGTSTVLVTECGD